MIMYTHARGAGMGFDPPLRMLRRTEYHWSATKAKPRKLSRFEELEIRYLERRRSDGEKNSRRKRRGAGEGGKGEGRREKEIRRETAEGDCIFGKKIACSRYVLQPMQHHPFFGIFLMHYLFFAVNIMDHSVLFP